MSNIAAFEVVDQRLDDSANAPVSEDDLKRMLDEQMARFDVSKSAEHDRNVIADMDTIRKKL